MVRSVTGFGCCSQQLDSLKLVLRSVALHFLRILPSHERSAASAIGRFLCTSGTIVLGHPLFFWMLGSFCGLHGYSAVVFTWIHGSGVWGLVFRYPIPLLVQLCIGFITATKKDPRLCV
ncbi:hypothetical protein BDV96DRAFT_179160 [Lophiotrema nucula]|uniref:Uncharacterized protein n=1 Tax=Lophiotrema nucula TaxID=690887 RepID=A0A6A5YXD6_9PLEO|nr:hypothetical protein BDV96DRAFT_179160 [Lophiotrema nucula]